MVVVSHDADFLDQVCTNLIHLNNQKLDYYKGGYSNFRFAHEQNRAAQEKQNRKDKAAGKAVEKIKDYVVKFNFLENKDDQPGVSVHDLTFSYTGQPPYLVENMNTRMDCASRIAICGRNGTGKSTLLKLVAGRFPPLGG